MRIHRYIYTRLSKDLSPSGKNGFQSAFIPDILTNKEVLEIESHIHFPEQAPAGDQSVVFYKQLKGETFLVLLRLRRLAEVRDEHGRGGTFLCEGFLLHEADWQPIWRIQDLISLVDPSRYPSLDALLADPAVDRAAGRIAPLELQAPADFWSRGLAEWAPRPDLELLMAMYNVAKRQDRELAIVVEGSPEAVTARLQACALFLPPALRRQAAWDDAFDGGKIFFSPLRIFGYSAVPPTTGRPVVFPAHGGAAQWPAPEWAFLGKPDDAFTTWLASVCSRVQPRQLLDDLFALSEALATGRPQSASMPSDPHFEELNKDRIRKVFIQGLLPQMEDKWAQKLGEVCTTAQQLDIWLRGYTADAVAALLEAAILTRGLNPEVMPSAPPAKLIRQGSPALQALACMWSLESPPAALMASLPDGQVEQVLAQLLGRGPHIATPYAAMVEHFAGRLHRLGRNPKVAENLGYYLAAKVPAAYKELRAQMGEMAVLANAFDALEPAAQTDWLGLLDRWLALKGGDKEVWKAVRQLGKSTSLDAYPVARAFATGEGQVPAALAARGPGREAYLQCLALVHGRKEKDVVSMGFSQQEWESVPRSGGLLGKLRRIFGG